MFSIFWVKSENCLKNTTIAIDLLFFCRKLALKLGKKANFKEISVQAIQLWPIDGKWCVNYKNQKKNFSTFPL